MPAWNPSEKPEPVNLSQAHAILQRLLDPLSIDQFLDMVLGRHAIRVGGAPDHFRCTLLGDTPREVVLDGFARLAPEMSFHGEAPTAPPPAKTMVEDADAFAARIGAYHDRGYTVRLPSLRGSTPALDEVLRALEYAFHKPVEDVLFWSRAGGRARVHHDQHDILVVQLLGRKRWHISMTPTELDNQWKNIPGAPPTLGQHKTIEVGPGDLLYLPRGTLHAVESLTDSLHLSIGFVPLTLREAMIAAVDHFSDQDRSLRESVGDRLGETIRGGDFQDISHGVQDAMQKLLQAISTPGFMAEALRRRSSRMVGDLPKLEGATAAPALTPDTALRHAPLAISHLSGNADWIDFSHPGEHVYVRRGVERSVAFIAETPAFRIRDIPGEIDDDVRIALAAKFLESGFLEPAE